ncbi:MAG: hypothetical protein JNM28_09900 [Armatimonadetes bacterium]|nr:hypothetical protein [Armatimonadota bacterium]
MTGLLTALAIAQTVDGRLIKAFDLFPPISESPTIALADSDSLKAKSLAKVYRGAKPGQAFIDNGIVQVQALVQPFGRIESFSVRSTGQTVADLPMPIITLNGVACALGTAENPLRPMTAQGTLFAKPFDIRETPGPAFVWPPRGMGVKFTWNHPEMPDLIVELRYQMVDREPVLNQTLTIRNGSPYAISIDQMDGGGQWPGEVFRSQMLHWVIRPGRVIELPDAWYSLDPQGRWVDGTRRRTAESLCPWNALKAKTLTAWPASESEVKQAAKAGYDAVLVPLSAGIAWSAPTAEDIEAVGAFVAMAKKAKVAAGTESDLGQIPAEPKDRTAGADSPVCWQSFAGIHWRQNALLTWRRLGIQFVQLSGELPGSCDKEGHGDHQGSAQARIENALATRDFLRAGLALGIVIRHPGAYAYGPSATY